jgi:lipoprotein-anchoring transpeptidase ErfK/SrfK
MKLHSSFLMLGIACFSLTSLFAESAASPVPTQKTSALKTASKSAPKQQGGMVMPDILKNTSCEPLSIHVSLSKQRVYFLVGGKVAVDSPISSGRRSGWTPKGVFFILEKDPNHQSTLYGEFVSGSGNIVRSNVCTRTDAAPSGTHFRGASMKYFMRLTPEGVGMHAGYLPGYPASHGCIRLPLEMAKIIYTAALVNTPVSVTD